jgi:hypothetical protein
VQAATHLAAGAALARALLRWPWLAAAIAALTHVWVDDLAQATYHPPDPLLDDAFWVGFHLLVLGATLATAWIFRRHAWILLAAMAPDLDWFVGRPLGLWEPGALHEAFRSLPGIASVSDALRASVPDWRMLRAAGLLEIGLFAALVLGARVRTRGAEAPQEDRPGA